MDSEIVKNNYEKFDVKKISRSLIKNAPYNPRKISDQNKKRLKDNIEKVGLLEPLVYNKQTGNLVSGHQRISILDSLNQSKEYEITVSEVDLDEKTEKEQNVFFNNTNAMGDYDYEKLQEFFKDTEVNFENCGMNTGDMVWIFGDNPDQMRSEDLLKVAEKIRENTDLRNAIKKTGKEKDETEFYLVVVFKDEETRNKFVAKHTLPMTKFQDGKDIEALIEKTKTFSDLEAPEKQE
jgi:hypothetical protein